MTPTAPATIELRDGRTATLGHVVEEDAAVLLNYVEAIAGETDFLTFGPGEFGVTLEQETVMIRGFADRSKGMMLKAVVDGEMVGNAMLSRSTRPRLRHACDLGLSVRKAFWGHGIGRALCRTIFEEAKRSDVTRVALRVRHDNARAIRMYEQMGFLHEGRLIGAFLVGGVAYDELAMGLQL